jgi:AcrR family transcriptional regulator
MTAEVNTVPRRSHARANRARILDAAREELARDPEASLEEIARAAGVVRRTVYGHFPNRGLMLEALVEEAARALAETVASVARRPDDSVERALARLIVASWPVGDRYRMLISIGRRHLGEERLKSVLAPGRAAALAILIDGQRSGAFADHLPPEVLNTAVEGLIIALLDAEARVVSPRIDGTAAATAVLVAVGVARDRARSTAEAVAGSRAAADDVA